MIYSKIIFTMPNHPPISTQVLTAVESRVKKKSEIAEILDVSVRQIDKLLLSGRWNAEQLEKLSKALEWKFVIDPYGSTRPVENLVNETSPKWDSPLTFNIVLNKNTAQKIPGLVQEMEDLIARKMRDLD